jgi:diamine N-acetyltransferase
MLEGKLIRLRAMEPLDVELLYTWENDTAIWKLSNTQTPFSKFVLEQYVATAHQGIYASKQLRLIICLKDNLPIGCIDLFDFDPHHKRAGIGILIADNAQKQKGYASDALDLLIRYSFDILHLHQLYCNISNDNEPSMHLFRKAGFEVTGNKKEWLKNGEAWMDEYFLQLFNTRT